MPRPHRFQPRRIDTPPQRKVFWFLIRWGSRLAIVGLTAGALLVFSITRNLPDPASLASRDVGQSTKIYDRTGTTVLYEVHGDERRSSVSLDDIPPAVKWATIAVEDKDFYTHPGFDLTGILRALFIDTLRGQLAQGGSTLTQQFIKNALLTNERTWQRKIRELVLAYRIEKRYTKDEILKLYLNEIPYGRNAYGVEAASLTYFGVPAKQLSLAQSAVLAGLIKAPSYYSPYGPHKDELTARAHTILRLMQEQGYISHDEEQKAIQEPLTFTTPHEAITAPHFVLYVKELLESRYGVDKVERGGLSVVTTLDLPKQQLAEKLVAAGAASNAKKFNGNNAALVSLDPRTGQILAMVGSADYFNDTIDGAVNVVLRPRQPGSSIKPFVYATAFEKGFTPDTPLYDVVTTFSAYPKDYEPHNYDDKEHGRVTMRQALAGSLNVPAVKTLYLTGVDRVLDMLNRVGYSTFKDRSRFGLSLVLGGGEVTLLEHAAAFSVLSQEGTYRAPAAILKVEDSNGTVLETFNDQPRQVMGKEIAQTVTSILSDNASRAFIFGATNFLTLPDRIVAAKTGTTNDFRDAWTMGYTPSLVTGVWTGNNDNTPMKKKADGSAIAAPIWNAFMKEALKGTPAESFTPAPAEPDNLPPILIGHAGGQQAVNIDRASGKRATERTPASFIEEKTYSDLHSILYYVNKDDPRGPASANPSTDPEYRHWEDAIARWASQQKIAVTAPPADFDDLHVPENVPTLSVTAPAENEVVRNDTATLTFSTAAARGVRRVEFRVDDALLSTVTGNPITGDQTATIVLPSTLDVGFHTLSVRAYDDIDNMAEVKRTVNVLRQ